MRVWSYKKRSSWPYPTHTTQLLVLPKFMLPWREVDNKLNITECVATLTQLCWGFVEKIIILQPSIKLNSYEMNINCIFHMDFNLNEWKWLKIKMFKWVKATVISMKQYIATKNLSPNYPLNNFISSLLQTPTIASTKFLLSVWYVLFYEWFKPS